MYDFQAERILKDTRAHFRAGFGASNKQYDTSQFEWFERFPEKLEKMRLRNFYRPFAYVYMEHKEDALMKVMNLATKNDSSLKLPKPFAANAPQMSRYAAKAAANSGHKAYVLHMGKIHACCAVDCELNENGRPPNLQEMDGHDDALLSDYSWIIDPWMNIVCLFRCYPLQASSKMRKWDRNAKQVQHESKWLNPRYFFPLMEVAPLEFEEVFPSGLTTKSARNIHNADP